MRRLTGDNLLVLRTLRIYEPCSCAKLASKLRYLDRERVYQCLYALGQMDLVDHPVRECYFLTGKGKLIFEHQTETPLFRNQ